jgi:hypothetical protein
MGKERARDIALYALSSLHSYRCPGKSAGGPLWSAVIENIAEEN